MHRRPGTAAASSAGSCSTTAAAARPAGDRRRVPGRRASWGPRGPATTVCSPRPDRRPRSPPGRRRTKTATTTRPPPAPPASPGPGRPRTTSPRPRPMLRRPASTTGTSPNAPVSWTGDRSGSGRRYQLNQTPHADRPDLNILAGIEPSGHWRPDRRISHLKPCAAQTTACEGRPVARLGPAEYERGRSWAALDGPAADCPLRAPVDTASPASHTGPAIFPIGGLAVGSPPAALPPGGAVPWRPPRSRRG